MLKGILQGILDKGIDTTLITSGKTYNKEVGNKKENIGVLNSLSSPHLRRKGYRYKFSANPIVTILKYSWVQVLTSFMALKYAFDKDAVFYINTILPVGPALIGKITGKRVVYHYHENAFIKSVFYRSLAKAMEKLADSIICVSQYQATFLKRKDNVTVVPNSLSTDFVGRLKPDPEKAFERKNVLMISSLKEYKGVEEFIKLAEMLGEYRFTIVLNANSTDIFKWIKDKNIKIPANCRIHPRNNDVAAFYNDASLVLNLSNSDLFVETFGMTVLEAMSNALPVIVPKVGGVAEMVKDGFNGYKLNVAQLPEIANKIDCILSNRTLYNSLAQNALSFSGNYSQEKTVNSILQILFKHEGDL